MPKRCGLKSPDVFQRILLLKARRWIRIWQHTTVLLKEVVGAHFNPAFANNDGAPTWMRPSRPWVDTRGCCCSAAGSLYDGSIADKARPRCDRGCQGTIADLAFSIRLRGLSATWARLGGRIKARPVSSVGPGRGSRCRSTTRRCDFSFRNDGPARHTHGHHARQSVGEWLRRRRWTQIAEVIRDYGEERFGCADRKGDCCSPPGSKGLLSRARVEAGPARGWRVSPHPRAGPGPSQPAPFRLFGFSINAELEELQQAPEAERANAARRTARLVVASIRWKTASSSSLVAKHSREVFDRSPRPVCPPMPVKMRAQGPGPHPPSADAAEANPRLRSASHRVAERTEVTA